MVLVALLKRKDATSVIVAVVAAFVLVQFITSVVSDLALKLSGAGNTALGQLQSPGWQQQYLQPFVAMILSFLVLELLVRLVLAIKQLSDKPSTKKRR